MNRPSVFAFSNYLVFLKDWLAFLKKEGQPVLSLRDIASLACVSPAAVSLGLSQKQILSEKTFEKMLPHLQLGSEELSYLRILRRISESPTEALRLGALQEALLHPSYIGENQADLQVYNYLSNWIHVFLHELVQLSDFEPDIKWIQKRSLHPIKKEEVQKAFEFLESAKFLKKDEKDRWQSTSRNLQCNGGVFSVSLHKFHQQILNLAQDSIKNSDRDQRNLQGLTFRLSQKQMKKINALLEETLDRVEAITAEDTDASSEVYHLEFALFPLTRKRTETKS